MLVAKESRGSYGGSASRQTGGRRAGRIGRSTSHICAGPAAAPSLRKLARDLGIDLTRVRGSQAGGRIVLEDVRAYIQRLQARASGTKAGPGPAPAPAPPTAEP